MSELEYKGWKIDFEGTEQDGLWDDAYSVEHIGTTIHHHKGLEHPKFRSNKEALESAVKRAHNWIDVVGLTIAAMGCKTVVDIRSPNARDYPFRFQLGDRVKSTLGGGEEGKIETGVYYGAASEGPYKIFYEIQRDDEMYFRLEESELELLN